MNEQINERPRLVAAGQGFSLNTVQYKNRFLYSKYNPTQAIISLIQNTVFLPDSIIIINSPCLWYGIQQLMEKAVNCTFIAVEADQALYEFTAEQKNLQQKEFPHLTEVSLFGPDDFYKLDEHVRKLTESGKYRRIIPIDFSAGTQFAKETYAYVYRALFEINERYWKNRVTLTRFGRLYSKNLLRNLSTLENFSELADLKSSVHKPIIVCGAGESLDMVFNKSNDLDRMLNSGNYYIIAVDAALTTLQDRGIKVDAAVLVESQFAITKAFIGADRNSTLLIKDMTSRPDIVFKNTVYFTSTYTEAAFIKDLEQKGILSSFIPPLGSVGLTAIEAAKILSDRQHPVYVAGLDFSYTLGKTHACFTPAHKALLQRTSRLSGIDNVASAFAPGNFKAAPEDLKPFNKEKTYTSVALKNYRDTLNSRNASEKNFFDLTDFGLKLVFPHGSLPQKLEIDDVQAPVSAENKNNSSRKEKIKTWLEEQKTQLETARDLLINGSRSQFRNQQKLEEQLESLLKNKEYLFLHFPDGFSYRADLDFLKRLRAETDYFLKQIDFSLKHS